VKGTIRARNLDLRYTAHGLNIFEPLYGSEGFSRAFSSEDVMDCMLVLIQEARGQEILVSKFHS